MTFFFFGITLWTRWEAIRRRPLRQADFMSKPAVLWTTKDPLQQSKRTTWWRFCWYCLLYFSWKVRFFDLIKHLSKLDQKTCVWKTSTLNKKENKKKGNRKEVKFMGIRISSNFFKSKKNVLSWIIRKIQISLKTRNIM